MLLRGTYGAQDCGWQLPIIIYNHPSASVVHSCQTQMCNSSDLREYRDDDDDGDYFVHKTIIYVRNFLRRSEWVRRRNTVQAPGGAGLLRWVGYGQGSTTLDGDELLLA